MFEILKHHQNATENTLAEPVGELYGHVTVRRLSQQFENHVDQYTFYPAGYPPYLDNVDECIAVYTAPQPQQPVEVPLKQIAEALRQHGLTLIKKANGYDVMKLGNIEAQQQPSEGPLLTDANIRKIADKADDGQESAEYALAFARAIEQAVRRKAGLK